MEPPAANRAERPPDEKLSPPAIVAIGILWAVGAAISFIIALAPIALVFLLLTGDLPSLGLFVAVSVGLTVLIMIPTMIGERRERIRAEQARRSSERE